MALPSPESSPPGPVLARAQGWIGYLLPLAHQGGPFFTVLLLLTLIGVLWLLVPAHRRLQGEKDALYERLLSEKQHQVELARLCVPISGYGAGSAGEKP